MCLAASRCNPAWHKSSTIVKNHLWRSYHNAFSNLQVQSCLPRALQDFDQHWQWGRFRATPIPSVFCIFLWKRALATVWCTFCRPHLPKVLQTCQFFNILKCKPSSRYSPVLFSWVSQMEPRNRDRGNRDPTTATTEASLHEKTHGFAPESLSPVNSHIPELLHFPPTWWWVVDMMMWLTWWWECKPWQSSVTRKLSN